MPRFSLDQIRKGIAHNLAQDPPKNLTRGEKGVVTGILNEACSGDVTRRMVLAWLFPETFPDHTTASSKVLSSRQWWALWKWIEPQRVRMGYWRHRDGLDDEVADIFMVLLKTHVGAIIKEVEEVNNG